MKTYKNLYHQICSYDNLFLAYEKARKHKTLKDYVKEFEKDLSNNLQVLRIELLLHSYRPCSLTTFVIRDPKTRKISSSEFRDRIVHHALCNIIEPIFDEIFIYDSCANRKGKGTFKAISRFDEFKRKISHNGKLLYRSYNDNDVVGWCLKADIKHYFEEVRQDVLIDIVKERIADNKTLWLIRIILENHQTKEKGKGMPLGNLTSQFFANVYLNKLDQYVKHALKIKHYIRYVDDFIILHESPEVLKYYKQDINDYLKNKLYIELHPDKSKIIPLRKGITFLGIRIFYYHKLLNKTNLNKFKKKLAKYCEKYDKKRIDYDLIYDFIEGWIAYTKNMDTYNLRNEILRPLEYKFAGETSTKEYNRHLKEEKKRHSTDSQITENKDNI